MFRARRGPSPAAAEAMVFPMQENEMTLTRTSILAIAIMGLLVGPAAAIAADWPCWRGPQRNGQSPDTGLLKTWPAGGPKLLWKVETLGSGFSTVSGAGGTIYASGDASGNLCVFAFDMNGKEKWKVSPDKAWTRDHPGSRSTPTIDGDRLYILSGNGVLACLKTADGSTVWSRDFRSLGGEPGGWGYAESVVILGELAIAKPGGENCIVAFNKNNGEIVWKSARFRAGPEYGSCVPFTHDGVEMIATGTRGGIVAVSAGTGKVLWSNPWCKDNVANCPDPQYADGRVFWANGYNKGGICLTLSVSGDAVAAEQDWTTRNMVCHHGGYVIIDGYIYGNHSSGWSCLDLRTGQVKWNERAVGKGSCTWADGMLYLFGEDGGKAALAACSPEGLKVAGEVTVQGRGPSWAHPVVIGGRLYLRYDTNLYCFDVKAL